MRKQREQETDKILDQIITHNTSFEDIFSRQHRTGKHQQIISTIPLGANFPTPRSANVPSPMTGRFSGADEGKFNTIKLEQLPAIHKSVIEEKVGQKCKSGNITREGSSGARPDGRDPADRNSCR